MKLPLFSRRILMVVLMLGGSSLFTHCGGDGKNQGQSGKAPAAPERGGSNGKTKIVVTTTMLADMVQAIAGEEAEVAGLMGPGVDPHTYELPARAIGQIRSADAIVYNGMLLEGKLSETLALSGQDKTVLAVADHLPKDRLLTPEDFEGHGDPHVWGDAALWAEAVEPVLGVLTKLMPEKETDLKDRAAAYLAEIQQLHGWIESRVAEVPEKHRTLVTSHDAFNYFGRAYGFEVIGVQGISTATDAGMADIVNTVDLVKERGVKAIFVESSVSKATIERIAKDAGVKIGGELFSDSCGPAGEMKTVGGDTYDVGTYLGMMKHNVNTVVEALK